MSYPPRLAEIVDALAAVPDRADRMQMLIDLAERFEEVPARVASRPFPADHQTPACESQSYVWSEPLPDGTLKYHFAVENPQGISARAMAVILDRGLSGVPLDEVVGISSDLVHDVFGQDLSMGKNMGLAGLVAMVQGEAKRRLAQR